MNKKIVSSIAAVLLLIFSLGCNYNPAGEKQSNKNEYKTLAQSIESYLETNECGILSGETSCFAGITTQSQDDHSKCSDVACKDKTHKNDG